MSKSSKEYALLSSKANSARTIIERAKREVSGFRNDYKKIEEQMVIGGYSSSTLYNYSRAGGSLALSFKRSPLELDNNEIHFHYKDYRKGAKKLRVKLQSAEFLRRFCLHILPKGFVRMRHYGILASKNKAKDLNIAKKDLGQPPWEKLNIDWREIALNKLKTDVTKCPVCRSGIMEIISVILPERGPAVFKFAASQHFYQTC